ncbi:hypothetical protein [Pusillibacter faecalis]|uniref:hypothetical protein n=1 Tax=Pusillibacter faecalis TaxID=2714358 RepID=UPI001BCFEC43|nr:hypothetical protein [Pusillibacter faecalis]MBS5658784.1 hypothetical protein [Oscillibacter sp.]
MAMVDPPEQALYALHNTALSHIRQDRVVVFLKKMSLFMNRKSGRFRRPLY